MAKSLNMVDKDILRILQRDARTSIAEIARRLNMSETAVRYRFKKLIEEGVIIKFSAILDPEKIGLGTCAIIGLKVDPGKVEEVANKLAKHRETQHIFQSTGEYDIMTIVHSRDLNELNELISEIKSMKGIRDSFLSITTRKLKLHTEYEIR